MKKKTSPKTNLALERLALLVVSLEIINQLLELLSKVVNYYGPPLRKRCLQLLAAPR